MAVVKALPPDDPHYVEQLEAALSLMFAALIMLEFLGDQAAFAISPALDSSQEIALGIIERATNSPVSPQVRALLAMRQAANN